MRVMILTFDDEGIVNETTYAVLVPMPRKYVGGWFVYSIPVLSGPVMVVDSYEYSAFDVVRYEEKVEGEDIVFDTLLQNGKLAVRGSNEQVFNALYSVAREITDIVMSENYDVHIFPRVLVHRESINPHAYVVASRDISLDSIIGSIRGFDIKRVSFSYILSPFGGSLVYSLPTLTFSLFRRKKVFVEFHVPRDYIVPVVGSGAPPAADLIEEFISAVVRSEQFSRSTST